MDAASSPQVTTEQVLEIFRATGGLKEGHFQLTSGLHSDQYFDKLQVLQYPEHTAALAAALASRFASNEVEVVIGPAYGGIILAYEVARQLGQRAIFATKDQGELKLRKEFHLAPGARALVVEDVITTGGSVKQVVELMRAAGAQVVGVAALIDRSGGAADVGAPLTALATLQVAKYAPAECPLCARGVPLIET